MVNSDGDIETKQAGATGDDARARRLAWTETRPDMEMCEALTHSLQQRSELRNCTIRACGQDRRPALVQQTQHDWPSGEIEVDVKDGTVCLAGKVISLSHKRVIEALAWRTAGCRGVDNRLQVVPDEADNDDELTDAIRLVLEMDRIEHADQIAIRSDDGVVTLQGVLPRDSERQLAEMDAWAVWGVKDVRNQIQVRS